MFLYTYYPSIGKLNILETCIFFFFFFHLNKLSHSNTWPGTASVYIYIYIYWPCECQKKFNIYIYICVCVCVCVCVCTWVSQKFCNILLCVSLCDVYISWLKQIKLWKFLAMVGSIVIIGVWTQYTLLYSMCGLKIAQMNVQCSLIWELALYEFELEAEATKNICCVKDEAVVDNRWLKKNFT